MNSLYICQSITNRPVVNVDMLLNYTYQVALNGLTFTLLTNSCGVGISELSVELDVIPGFFYTGKLPVITSFSNSYCQQGYEVLVDDEP